MQLNNWNVGKDFICLAIDDKGLDGDRVFSISVEGGVVEFTEGCDSYFNVKTTPDVAIAALLEAVDWIRVATLRQRPVVDDARMARALEWVRVMAMQDADGSHVPAIEEAIAAYDPNCGGRTVRVVDDAMVERACRAYEVAMDGDVFRPEVPEIAMRIALLAAYQQDNGGQQG